MSIDLDDWSGPRSVCACGHLGDGDDSEHSTLTKNGTHGEHQRVRRPGHGGCTVDGCECPQFEWRRFTEAFERYLREQLPPPEE